MLITRWLPISFALAALTACTDPTIEYGSQRAAFETDIPDSGICDADEHPDATIEPPPPPPPPPESPDAGEPTPEPSPDATVEQAGCKVTGGGHMGEPGAGSGNEDSFGFNAHSTGNGSARGQIQNTTHLGDKFHGSVSALACWHDGGAGPDVPGAPYNTAEFSGTGRWNRSQGYTFRVLVHDRAEPGRDADEYSISIFDPSGALIYEESGIIHGGNIQLHRR